MKSVLAIRHYTLKEGVDPQEFERFVVEEWNTFPPDYVWPGWQYMIMKGDRGMNVGQYILVIEMNSLYLRNFFAPGPGGELSEAAKAIKDKCREPTAKLQKRFNELVEMTEGTGYTDYVEIVKK